MKLMIIDGHAFVFKAYFAFAATNLKNSLTGKPSAASFGFFKMLFKMITDFKPTNIAVTFDPGTPLERGKVYPEYKAQRKPMPEDLKPQILEVIEILRELNFPVFIMNGHEADDIIGTICVKFGKKKNEIMIFSGDKDLFQLINPNVKMYRGTKGASEFIEINEDWLESEMKLKASQIIDYMGIVGDSADNIPGVHGIGEKGAEKLIVEYKNLETIYKNIDSIKNPSLKEKLIKNKENAFLSRDLARLKVDLEIEMDEKSFDIPNFLSKECITVFQDRGFNKIAQDLSKQAGIKFEKVESKTEAPKKEYPANSSKGKFQIITEEKELIELIKIIEKEKLISFDTETTSVNAVAAKLVGISVSYTEDEGFYIPVKIEGSFFSSKCIELETILKYFKPILENPNIKKIGQNIKYDLLVLKKYNIDIKGIIFDTMLASFLIDPDLRRHGMDAMAEDLLGYKTITYDELTGVGKKRKALHEIEIEKVGEYAAEDAFITLRLYNILKEKIKEYNSEKILNEFELPLIDVLADMESQGVMIDSDYFKTLSIDFDKKIKKLEKKIHSLANKEFNIASTQELQKVLFDELKLPTDKKIKTGFSTNHSVLEGLLGVHPIIDELLEYRKFTKLKSTYIDALPLLINSETKKIHTNYNQTIAATGRLSSTDPNLQNIPIKDEEGKLIRKGFISPSKDYQILSLDYSQIELRIMAHFSNDQNMIQAYKNNADIHKETAMAIFGVSADEVNSEMRNKAKIVNFSVIYGVTSYGLGQNLKLSRSEAGIFIDKYFIQYPGVKKYMDEICEFCAEKGYVETYSGRKRYIPSILSTKRMEQEGAKRIAINSPIQGTSADMIKLAMIKIHDKLKKFKSKMIMQVHDELVLEVHIKEKEEIFQIAKKEMESVYNLRVPIIAQGNFGDTWEEAH